MITDEVTEPKLTNNLGNNTVQQWDSVIEGCRDIYLNKTKDYGTSWRVLRPRSLTDQIFIKAKRIQNIEEMTDQKIDEGTDVEYQGIINYCLIALIQLELGHSDQTELSEEEAMRLYNEKVAVVRELMLAKNHDYGEAWRDLRSTSFTDLILMKLMRLKQIEDNDGKTLISEGTSSHYMDIVNYAVFALIKSEEA